jgi:hypothetical protein
MTRSRQNLDVREFILRNIRTHPADIAAVTAARRLIPLSQVNQHIGVASEI